MKKYSLLLAGLLALAGLICASTPAAAQGAVQRYAVAILKWDGGDTVQVMTPDKSEVVHVYLAGGKRTKEIPEEEYCLTWVANKMALEGWEPVNLNNRRIFMRKMTSR